MFGRKKSNTPQSRRAARIAIRKGPKMTQNYTKYYTIKEFKKFSPDVQQILTNRYNVILTVHKTKREKLGSLKPTRKSVSRGITKFNKGVRAFDAGLADLDRGFKVVDESFTSKRNKSKYNLDILAGF